MKRSDRFGVVDIDDLLSTAIRLYPPHPRFLDFPFRDFMPSLDLWAIDLQFEKTFSGVPTKSSHRPTH